MKAIVIGALFAASVCHVTSVCAEEAVWPKIRKMIEEVNRIMEEENSAIKESQKGEPRERDEAWRRYKAKKAETLTSFREYMESFTTEQLIIAGRRCGREIQDAIDSGRPSAGEGAMALQFFIEYYPLASNNVQDVRPILREITDKSQPAVWRCVLSDSMLAVNDNDELSAKLTNDQRQQVFDCVGQILNDQSDSIQVRYVIPSRLARMLSKMFKDYTDAARGDVPHQRAEKEQRLTEFSQRVEQYVADILKLFSDPTTPMGRYEFRARLLGDAMICYREGLPGAARAKDVVIDAFAHYQDYPESLWPTLAAYAIDDFHVPNANEVLDEMISKASDEGINSVKDQLQYRKQRSKELEAIRKKEKEQGEKE